MNSEFKPWLRKVRDFLCSRWLTGIEAALITISAAWISFAPQWELRPEWQWSMVLAFIVLAVSAVLLMVAHWNKEGSFRSRNLAVKRNMAEELVPVVESVIPMINSKAQRHSDGLRRETLNALLKLLNVDQLRLCVYHLDRRDEDGEATRILSYDNQTVGRSDPPHRKDFVEGGGLSHDANFAMIDKQDVRLVSNVAKDFQSDSQGSNYQCYLNATISADNRVFGMITADAPGANTLRDEHKPIVRLMSRLLGVSMVRRREEGLNSSPTPPRHGGP